MVGKAATKGQKQIDKENAESMKFYTMLAIGGIAVSAIPVVFYTASYLLPIFGLVIHIIRIIALNLFEELVFN